MVNYKKLKLYCCGDFSKIENFATAVVDPDEVWQVHHKNGEVYSVKELKEKGLYYHRPPEELILLTKKMHQNLHASKTSKRHGRQGGNSGSFKKGQIPWNKGKNVDTSQYENYGKHKSYHRAWNAKKILCVETNTIYDSIDEAAKSVGLKSHCGINLCCLGKQSTAGGFHWEYKESS